MELSTVSGLQAGQSEDEGLIPRGGTNVSCHHLAQITGVLKPYIHWVPGVLSWVKWLGPLTSVQCRRVKKNETTRIFPIPITSLWLGS
jgi:hypothetical protein